MVDETGKRRNNKKFATGTAAGVVTGGLLIVAALNLVPPRTAVTAVPSSTTPSAAATTTPPPAVAPSASETPSATPTPTPTSASPSAAPTTTKTTTSKPAGEVLTSLPRLSYVAVFKWLPKSSYSAADAAAYAAENQRGGQRVVAIDGNLIQKAGNWGIGVANLDDFAEATATCKAMGFGTTGQDCFRRAVL